MSDLEYLGLSLKILNKTGKVNLSYVLSAIALGKAMAFMSKGS